MKFAAIAAIPSCFAGVKTSFEDRLKLGWRPVAMLLGETIFDMLFIVAAVLRLKLSAA